jgi:NADPH-dependent 2,4-dienoyl-CoA reductase/sulfur reductase-like enzyme
MEVAASLRQLGVAVTLIHRGGGLFDQVGSERLSVDLLALYGDQGVDVWLEEEVARFGGDDNLEYVEVKSGLCVEADMAVVGVGVVPNTRFLAGSGLAVDDGVVVDERFATSAPGVYAAGDVANFFDPLFGRQRRIEHWSNANYQGTEVGRILAGQGDGYSTVASFFSEVFGLTVKVFGDVSRYEEVRSQGSLAAGDLLTVYGHNGGLVGALTVGQTEDVEAGLRDLIRAHEPLIALNGDLAGVR